LIEKSVTYVTEGVMGSGKFPPAFTGEYLIGDEKGKLYLFSLESDTEATELFDWYAGEIGAETGKALSNHIEYSVADGEAPYRGAVKIFGHGRFMCILSGFAADSGSAETIAGEFITTTGTPERKSR
jgi:hypothetical protein